MFESIVFVAVRKFSSEFDQRRLDRFVELKQKHSYVEEHFDEDVEVEELPSARPPVPKLITTGVPDTVKR